MTKPPRPGQCTSTRRSTGRSRVRWSPVPKRLRSRRTRSSRGAQAAVHAPARPACSSAMPDAWISLGRCREAGGFTGPFVRAPGRFINPACWKYGGTRPIREGPVEQGRVLIRRVRQRRCGSRQLLSIAGHRTGRRLGLERFARLRSPRRVSTAWQATHRPIRAFSAVSRARSASGAWAAGQDQALAMQARGATAAGGPCQAE